MGFYLSYLNLNQIWIKIGKQNSNNLILKSYIIQLVCFTYSVYILKNWWWTWNQEKEKEEKEKYVTFNLHQYDSYIDTCIPKYSGKRNQDKSNFLKSLPCNDNICYDWNHVEKIDVSLQNEYRNHSFICLFIAILPKNYDPKVDPDPERWIPRRERSYYRGKRKDKRKDIGWYSFDLHYTVCQKRYNYILHHYNDFQKMPFSNCYYEKNQSFLHFKWEHLQFKIYGTWSIMSCVFW